MPIPMDELEQSLAVTMPTVLQGDDPPPPQSSLPTPFRRWTPSSQAKHLERERGHPGIHPSHSDYFCRRIAQILSFASQSPNLQTSEYSKCLPHPLPSGTSKRCIPSGPAYQKNHTDSLLLKDQRQSLPASLPTLPLSTAPPVLSSQAQASQIKLRPPHSHMDNNGARPGDSAVIVSQVVNRVDCPTLQLQSTTTRPKVSSVAPTNLSGIPPRYLPVASPSHYTSGGSLSTALSGTSTTNAHGSGCHRWQFTPPLALPPAR
ncbi:serine/threonine-protein kinase WNK2-like protein [Lates japonicus]|uniref:Serine/threonine-protein kinase WNK2-like protein n=1 Tax=Lates japonicus TaxID=270547 RepID=A0AAD3M214_LATJO|nr:serine/threonine-protein kinase WNK2-like protein [Lates japonicus]